MQGKLPCQGMGMAERITALREKFKHLVALGCVDDMVAIARHFGVAKKTLDNWLSGANGAEPESLPRDRLESYRELVRTGLPPSVSDAELDAIAFGSLDGFKAAFMNRSHAPLDRVLRERAAEGRLALVGDGGGLVQTDLRKTSKGALSIKPRARFHLTLSPVRLRHTLCLQFDGAQWAGLPHGLTDDGRTLAVPGFLDDGTHAKMWLGGPDETLAVFVCQFRFALAGPVSALINTGAPLDPISLSALTAAIETVDADDLIVDLIDLTTGSGGPREGPKDA